MKRLLMIIMICFFTVGILTACGPDQKQIQEDFIAILEQPASEDTIKEATEYLDEYLTDLDEEVASDLVLHLEHYILGFDQNGINYEEWAKHYDQYVAASLKDLYEIRTEEQQAPILKDTVLQVSWNELAQRAFKMEEYIAKYKDQPLIEEDAKWLYGNYINAMVMGSNGTPIFDYQTYGFNEDAKKAYAAFINQHPESVTAWVLTEYFSYLNSIKFSMDYNDKVSSKLFFDTCDWLVSESGKRVFQ